MYNVVKGDIMILEKYPKYDIMQNGDIISLNYNNTNKPKALKKNLNHNGYEVVSIVDKDGYKAPVRVHRLVAMAFLDKDENRKFVNHIDGDKTNNNVSNLEWCTHKENMKHASEKSLLNVENNPRYRKGVYIGDKACNVKLSEENVVDIRNRYSIGASPKTLANEYNVSIGTIESIIYKNHKNASWTHIPYPEVKVNARDKQRKPVIQLTKEGVCIAEFKGMREAMSKTGVDRSDIGRCCKGKAKTAGGYIWKYKEIV